MDDTQGEIPIQLTTNANGNEKINVVRSPHITINVDMSEWSDEKIEIFFKYAYGKFEED